MQPITPKQRADLRQHLPNWTLADDGSTLSRTFQFPSFRAAIRFMEKAIPEIDRLNHHPDWRNVWKRLDVTLTTHDADGMVTSLDVELARVLDRLFDQAQQGQWFN